MTEKYNRREKEHLFNLIRRRSGDTPNFAILVGAGASISSGAKPTCQMIDEWRHQLHRQSRSTDPFDKWLEKQDWFKDDDEYSMLFEKIYDQPAQRRNYVEECVKDARPSWGYIYLSNLLVNGFFNVVFTPNFDDLINEACSSTDCRPIVCAHDSAVSTIRVTSKRPKVIKLHGDFLYDTIKNTLRETDSLEKNMQDKFVQFAKDYGLIVLGYGGNDTSIMDILNSLVRSGGYFPHGVYWCLKTDAQIGRKLDRFLQRENVYLIEIDGFDEFMAELHESLGLILPDTVKDPYKATTEKLNRFIETTKGISNRIIEKDISQLQTKIKSYEKMIIVQTPSTESYIPFRFLALAEYRNGRPLKAAEYYEKELLRNPSDVELMDILGYAYYYGGKGEEALRVADGIKKQFPKLSNGYCLAAIVLSEKDPNKSLSYLEEGLKSAVEPNPARDLATEKSYILLKLDRSAEALSAAEDALRIEPRNVIAEINKCFALKKLDRTSEAVKLANEVLSRPGIDDYSQALIYAFLGKKEEMLKPLQNAFVNN
ncbi:SIR2 family protein, partial [Candidatus Bathyarchaeota archaeon]|nr:SIR2 family protein [Candidatus Bathyarchaeota archaeon]